MKGIEQFISRLQKLDTYHSEYGYFEGDIHQSSGLPMAELAGMLNDGYGDIPARPFVDDAINSMTRWFQTNKTWKVDVWNYLKNGGRVDSLYKKYANIGADTIRAMMDVNDYADNVKWWEDMKIAKYGSTRPLVETTELYDSASAKVFKGTK